MVSEAILQAERESRRDMTEYARDVPGRVRRFGLEQYLEATENGSIEIDLCKKVTVMGVSFYAFKI